MVEDVIVSDGAGLASEELHTIVVLVDSTVPDGDPLGIPDVHPFPVVVSVYPIQFVAL